MNESPPILYAQKNGVATITFNREEKHHAFDDGFIAHFVETLNTIRHTPQVKVLVIQSTGRSFCAGADLQWMQRMVNYSHAENIADATALDTMMHSLATMSIPTVAVVQGACFGGALGLLACCHIVIASTKSTFCFSEAKLGLIPAVISPYVIRATGVRFAQKMFLTAERFDANTALQANLCHEIVEPEDLSTRANNVVQSLLDNGPSALKAINALCNEIAPIPSASIRTATCEAIAHIRTSDEAQEGIHAFFEKRTPNWKHHD